MENRKFNIKQGYVAREVAGEYLAVPVDNSVGSNMIVLNEVSKFLWDKLKTEKSFDELLDAMLGNYDVSKEEAEADLKDFLMQLIENGLVE